MLDVRGISPIADYLVIATGTSPRQMRTVCDEAAALAEQHDYSALSRAGLSGETWMLIDLVDVVVHVFNQQARLYYDLDGLWGDAQKVPLQPAD